jgi:predicted O-linked N-acetylglucosamine transferase (SPINDLY family)/GT2 family glycosyltransferase
MFKNYRIIVVTPAGRKRYLEILLPYILRSREIIDEYHLWINTTNKSDINYMNDLAKKFPDFIKLISLNIEPSGNSTIRFFFQNCIDKDTIYIRIDDDICFLEKNAIKELLNFRIFNQNYFIIYANIINNSICSYVNQRKGSIGFSQGNTTYDVFCNTGWKSGEFASFIHSKFIEDNSKELLNKYQYSYWILSGFERVSVNFITWFGKDFAEFNGIIDGEDEEQWLSVDKPKNINRYNCICGSAIVSHFSYYTQREYLESKTNILQSYKLISEEVLSSLFSQEGFVNNLEVLASNIKIQFDQEKHVSQQNPMDNTCEIGSEDFIQVLNVQPKKATEKPAPSILDKLSIPAIQHIIISESRPFWSVMIPTYNCANYLIETLKSVLAQDPGSEQMQIEVVDDCSTKDDPEAIVKEMGQGRVSFFRKPQNGGIAANFNTCIERAKGEWIHILHGDDAVLPGFYSILRESIEKEPNTNIGAAFTRCIHIDENSTGKQLSYLHTEIAGIIPDFWVNLTISNSIFTPSIVIKRSVYEKLGGFHTKLGHTADWEMWKRISVSYPIWYEPQPLALYREHSKSDTSRLIQTGENINETLKAINITQSYLPQGAAAQLSYQAKEHTAHSAFGMAYRMINERGDIYGAINQIREGLKCSTSSVVLNNLASLLAQSELLLKLVSSLLVNSQYEYLLYNFFQENDIVNIAEDKNKIYLDFKEVFKPLVSLCIPTYNGETFISEAINSVLSQTYPNIEIILSDDNSTDRTVEIAKSFNEKLSFDFSILEHTQHGLADNWNFCISQAKGKYIKFLFQDDLLEPTAIEEMVTLAEQDEEIGLVFSPRTLFTNTGRTVYDSNFLMHHEAKDVHKAWSTLKLIQSGHQLLQDSNILDNPINKIGEPSTVLIRKDVFEKVGLFNSEFCQLVDLEMWLRIMSQYKVGFVDKVLSHFRIHPQQQTRRNVALKDAILSDYQKLFQTIYSDTRYPQATRQQALYRYAVLSEQNSELQQLRKQIAEECLNTSDEQITDVYVGLLRETHKMLVNSSIKYETLTDEEQTFANDIVKTISQGFDQPKAIQHLLVAMLYRRADQLPLQYDLSHIPHWLLKDYLQFLFSCPVHFQEPGDANNYYYYMQGWIDYLHKYIFKNSDSQLWHEIVNNFVSIANFIPLYFNEYNLKDIYVKRGKIIEFLLNFKGYEVDYEFADRPIDRKKIRLGVLAAHFLPGSETFAYLPIYEHISRDFEVILYSLNQTGHQLEQYCQSCANSFKLLPQDLAEQVNIIRADDIDILFIATNITAVTNQICFLSMHRLARIQVTSGGSVVTTGIRHIDYYISGTLTEPSATAEQQYQEKLVKLEGTAHCFSYGNEQENVTIKVDRESLGISEEKIIFISGANFFKIIPKLIDTWAKIISGVSNSVLMLLPFGPNWSNTYPKKAFVNQLNKVFSKYGIPADQVIVLDPQPVPNRQEIKEYFKIADIYLDSFPFAGTTSLIEPLQVNLPVITRRGTSFRSAMGAAMVQSLDISDLVADSEESYIQLAIALGNNPELRQQKSAQIKEKMQGNPSFLDSRAYSAKIGSLFQELFSKYLADNLSQNFRLGDINLIIFPDWLQPEDLLYQDLASVISTLTTHPDKSQITLLIDTHNISEEEADMLLSSLTMNLLMEDDVDITEGPEISLLGKISDAQWKTLLPRINTRIALAVDNQSAIAQAKAENLPFCDVDSLRASKLEMTPI